MVQEIPLVMMGREEFRPDLIRSLPAGGSESCWCFCVGPAAVELGIGTGSVRSAVGSRAVGSLRLSRLL